MREEENEQDDKLYVDELCNTSEDYEANKEECDKLYSVLFFIFTYNKYKIVMIKSLSIFIFEF